ncbi:MAG: hypothetical protein ACK4YP_14500 [Myxococcota bacterium]
MRHDPTGTGERPAPAGTEDLAAEAVRTFQPFYDQPLTPQDGRAIVRNMTDVLLLLAEWKRDATPPAPAPAPAPLPPADPPMAAKPARKRRTRKFPAETL